MAREGNQRESGLKQVATYLFFFFLLWGACYKVRASFSSGGGAGEGPGVTATTTTAAAAAAAAVPAGADDRGKAAAVGGVEGDSRGASASSVAAEKAAKGKREAPGGAPAKASPAEPAAQSEGAKTKASEAPARKAPRRHQKGCTLLMVAAVLLPDDAAKRSSILLELGMAFTSAFLAHPSTSRNSLCFGVITDSSTRVSISEQLDEVLQGAGFSGGDVMDRLEYFRDESIWDYEDKHGRRQNGFNVLGRFKGYGKVLASEAAKPETERRHIVFIDSDIVFTKNIFGFYARRGPGGEPFDAGLTYRMMPKFPINTGVMYFHRERLGKGAAFMAHIVRTYQLPGKDYPQRMLGDQLVMNDLLAELGRGVKLRRKVHEQRVRHQEQGLDILVVHIDRWNWSPQGNCRVPRRAHLLHFKGELKRKMFRYYELVMTSLPKQDPTQLTMDLNKLQAAGKRVQQCKY